MYRKWKKTKFGEDTTLFSPNFMLISADDYQWLKRAKTATVGSRRSSKVGPMKARTSITRADFEGHTDPRGSISSNRVSSGKHNKRGGRSTPTQRDSKRNSLNNEQSNLPPITGTNEVNPVRSTQNGIDRRTSTSNRKDSRASIGRASQSASPVPHPPAGAPSRSSSRALRRRTTSQSPPDEKASLLLVSSQDDATRHEVGILCCAVSQDQSICITGSGSQDGTLGTIRAWDPHTGTPLSTSPALCQRITGVSCSPRYPLLAWVQGEGSVVKFMEMGRLGMEENNNVVTFQIELPGDDQNPQSLVPGWNTLTGSSDGNHLLATSTNKNSIFVINMQSGNFEEVTNIHKGAVLGGHFSTRGDKFLTWCSAYVNPFDSAGKVTAESEIKIFDTETKNELFSVTADGTASKGKQGWENKAGFASVRFHPSRPVVACTTHTGMLQIREASDLSVTTEIQAHSGSTPGLRFSRDGEFVVTCSDDHFVKVWHFPDLTEVATYDVGVEATCVDTLTSSNGSVLINCGDSSGALTVLQLKLPAKDANCANGQVAGQPLSSGSRKNSVMQKRHSHHNTDQVRSDRGIEDQRSRGPSMNSGSNPEYNNPEQDNMSLKLVLRNSTEDLAIKHTNGILSCTVSSDQTVCVTGSGDKEGEQADIRTWDPMTGKPLGASKPLGRRITGLSYSARYSILGWSRGEGNVIEFWDQRQLEQDDIDSQTLFQITMPVEGPEGDSLVPGCGALNSSVDGSYMLATSPRSSSICIINMKNGQIEELRDIHEGAVLGGCFSPRGDRFLTWCSAFKDPFQQSAKVDAVSEMKLFDADSLAELCSVELEEDHCKPQPGWENKAGFCNVTFHPKLPIVACTTSTGHLQFRDAQTLGLLSECEAHSKVALGLRFSRDGKFAVTCADDHMVKVWSVPGQAELASYDIGAEAACIDTMLSPTGNLVVNCGDSCGRLSALELVDEEEC